MGRPSVLPLPDAAVRRILAGIGELKEAFPASHGNRPFLVVFIRLVHDATGKVFGAGTMRLLLKTFAPEYRPSTVTLQDEIQAFRDGSAKASPTLDLAVSAPKESQAPLHENIPSMLAGIERLLARARPDESHSYRDALVQTLQAENERLRQHRDFVQTQLQALQIEFSRTAAQIEGVKAERDAKAAAITEMAVEVEKLAKAVADAHDQIAASHRFAMGRIEDATAEVRLWKEHYREAQKEIQAVKKDLQTQVEATQAYRRSLNAHQKGIE